LIGADKENKYVEKSEKDAADHGARSKTGGVTIREMELDDLPVVYSLGEQLFTAEKWPNLYRTWDEYELVEQFASDGEFCLVAEIDDKIVGFALGTLIEKRRSAWSYGWLLWLGLDITHKRRGIGKRLVNELTERFIEHGARMMIVDTDAKNYEALGFFQKQGFGDEIRHVYLSRNLTTHPEYVRRKAEKLYKKTVNRTPRARVSNIVLTENGESFEQDT